MVEVFARELTDPGEGISPVRGYSISEAVYVGRTRIIYRGRCEDDGAPIIVKTLIDGHRSASGETSLRREYEILSALKIEGVVQAYALARFEGRLALILEDTGGERLKTLIAAGPLQLVTFLRLGIQLAHTVAELHQHNVIHKDINPNNILVSLESGRLKLIDFSIASRVPSEHQRLSHPSMLEGTIAYMSPEQTGRMNRDLDYRTDLYSLGVTFYEMLTGKLPFDSADPLEVIHYHIAKSPPPPGQLSTSIPGPVSDIVMKLLSKTAESRYQSALGLEADLTRCLKELEATGRIDHVLAGEGDVFDRFVIPQHLYGRQSEIEVLMAAFERVCEGTVELMLVSGYAGIGKTSLIQELYQPIVRRRGYFIAGKFDQIIRTPYGALIQAFRGLVHQLLTENEDQLAVWRSRLADALGTNGGVLAEVIPEIELIMGQQPQPPPLAPTEAQNRFRLVLGNFVGALARKEHPLVVFLDDLQWADTATLNLLEPLLAGSENEYILLIGAYRDNEVDEAHALTRTLTEVETAGVATGRLPLGPLALADLILLVRDTLHCEAAEAEPLARLVSQKTEGNPFFVGQFLKALRDAELLKFDYETGRWTVEMDAIARARMTDNVIDLMTRKIQRLPAKTQHALTLAACIGNQFDQHTLAIVSEQSLEAAADDLKEAINEGLILPAGRYYEAAEARDVEAAPPIAAYAFLHDRVQQSAYALIPAGRKQIVHLTVGRLLRSRVGSDQGEEKLFDIVHHLNLGRDLIADAAERVSLARLNLSAGQKAKSSTAHEAALGYLRAGLGLVTEALWDSDYGLAFALHLEAAECQYLCGNFDEAEQQFALLLHRATTSLDKAKVYRLRSVQYENMSRYADALTSARESLTLFGVSFPDSAEERQAALESEIAAIQSLLGHRSIASLVDLPVMTDPEVRMVMNILTDIWSSAYIVGDAVLARLISAAMVRLSLVHGNLEESAYGYVTHAITVGPVRGDYQSAYEFGRLALCVNERFSDSRRRAKIQQQFHAHVNLWRQPMPTCIPYAREACRSGLETGDFLYAAYGATTETWPAMVSTQDLAQFVRDYSPNLTLIKKLKATSFADSLKIILNWARALQGKTRAPLSLSDEAIDENDYVETYRGNPFFTTFYAVAKLHLSYVFGEYGKALDAARTAREVVYHLSGTIWPVMFDFWNGLTLAANYADATEHQRRAYLEEMEKAQKAFAVLAENCPENFLCQSLLLSAEIERIAGRQLSALDLYERAIRYAGETSMLQHQALANELYAKFWRMRGQPKVAAGFMAEARFGYARWGAVAKVADLERKYPDLLDRGVRQTRGPGSASVQAPATALATTEDQVATLDAVTAIRAAQTISGEIDLERLLRKLIRIAMENAGAERGLLFQENEGRLVLVAESVAAGADPVVLQQTPLEERRNLSRAIVNLAHRTGESVLVGDAERDPRWLADRYVIEARPKSILCVPIVRQGKRVGLFYLENNLIAEAFTSERIEMMQILAAQAGISLENARLYQEMRQEVERRSRAEQSLREAVSELEDLKNRLQAENVYLQEEIRTQYGFEEIIGRSSELRKVLRQIEQVAATDSTALITGETGTGKELLARAIHNLSGRRDRQLVTVNCGAIAAGLIESELFGHEKGAFTGALQRKIGRFELAHGGTIFLDEIGDLALDLQVKLLRVLQEGEIERLGGSKPIKVDIRVIAATHHDLKQAVEAGRFRLDLFYRLNVFPIRTPPLRERPEDIPPLVRYFVTKYGPKLGKRIESIPKSTLDALVAYPWPGNIRELRNVIERSIITSPASTLELGDWITAQRGQRGEPSPRILEEVERDHIIEVLELTGWRVSGTQGAAEALGLKPTTLEARMKKLGIKRPS